MSLAFSTNETVLRGNNNESNKAWLGVEKVSEALGCWMGTDGKVRSGLGAWSSTSNGWA